MEVEGQDGSTLQLNTNSDTVFGRGLGFNTKDNTVSRRHVIFNSNEDPETATFSRVSFQITGKNPIWIRRGGGGEKIQVFRSSESGVVEDGDWFCVSSQNPVWFYLKSLNLETFDVSKIDPVKEFGFLVIGQEFDGYNKQKIGVENWNWFLEDESCSDDEEESGGEKKRRKRKKSGRGGDDENWSGESEEDKKVVLKKEVGVMPKYMTRSKEASKVRKDVKIKKNAPKEEEEEEEEDDEDETLGGFIVGDENEVGEEELDESEEEEEEEEGEEFVDEED